MRVCLTEATPELNYLTSGKHYLVLGLSADSFRVLDDKGEPILYPRSHFEIVDDEVPDDWVWDRYAADEFYADPPGLHVPGFYEDYFDGKEYARERFNDYLRRIGHDRGKD